MGFVNTRLEMPGPGTSRYEPGNLHGRGSYGIMQLVQNPSSDTLGEAATLTGISEEKLKTDRASNILGGAALLSASQGRPRPQRLRDWLGGLDGRGGNGERYQAVSGVGAGEAFAQEVLELLGRGIERETVEGESISIAPRDVSARH